MVRTHKFEEMRPREFRAEFERAPVIYCPFGGVEYHGVHSCQAVDFRKGYEICLRTAAIAGGIVHPVIPIVPGKSHRPGMNRASAEEFRSREGGFFHAYPAVFGGDDLCRAICEEMFYFFADALNFKLCIAFGSHAGAKWIKEIESDCSGRISGMRLVVVSSGEFIRDELMAVKKEYKLESSSAHGGLWETSMAMALYPDGVDLSELDKPLDGFHKMPDDVNRQNRHATAEFGEFLMNTYAERLAERVRDILDSEREKEGSEQ